MPSSPYSPPEADMGNAPTALAGPVKSVLTGVAVDIGGSLALGVKLQEVIRTGSET
jgi:hypothetical protein